MRWWEREQAWQSKGSLLQDPLLRAWPQAVATGEQVERASEEGAPPFKLLILLWPGAPCPCPWAA